MTAPWNGLPDQPEHTGWHWLALKAEPDAWELHFWDQSLEVWGHRRSSLPEAKAKKYIYGEPARDPSELAQMRKDERDRCAGVFDQEARDFIECMKDTTSNLDSLKRAHDEAVAIADKIRALTDDEGKKS